MESTYQNPMVSRNPETYADEAPESSMIDWYDIDLGDGASFTLTSQLNSASKS